jgi:hypothetical protein
MCRATATFSDINSLVTPPLYSAAAVPAHVAAAGGWGGGGGGNRLLPLAAANRYRWQQLARYRSTTGVQSRNEYSSMQGGAYLSVSRGQRVHAGSPLSFFPFFESVLFHFAVGLGSGSFMSRLESRSEAMLSHQ